MILSIELFASVKLFFSFLRPSSGCMSYWIKWKIGESFKHIICNVISVWKFIFGKKKKFVIYLNIDIIYILFTNVILLPMETFI